VALFSAKALSRLEAGFGDRKEKGGIRLPLLGAQVFGHINGQSDSDDDEDEESTSNDAVPSRRAKVETPKLGLQPDTGLYRGNFVLLAAFDGIRGCSVALDSLGIEPIADYSSEIDPKCKRFIATKFPNCVQLGDLKKVNKELLEDLVERHGRNKTWLVVGGSPCQDLSRRRGPMAKGLAGKKSKMFFEFVRVVSMLMSLEVKVVFLLENVASMKDEERDTITKCLGVVPVQMDSVVVSACHRLRYYWTNLPVRPLEPVDIDIDALLDDGWYRHPKGKPFRCFVASAAYQAKRGRDPMGVRSSADHHVERPPNADEREVILGFPRGYTRLPPGDPSPFDEGQRLKMVGNSFSVQVVAHLLSSFAESVKRGMDPPLIPLREDAVLLRMDRIMDEPIGFEDCEDVWYDMPGFDEAS